MIYSHWSQFPMGKWVWENFSPRELSCKHCGEYFHHVPTLDAIQFVRWEYDAPIYLNSAHRCRIHNARIGGAPRSMHKMIALDLSCRSDEAKRVLWRLCERQGFKAFGFYKTFLHVDMRNSRARWFGKGAKRVWTLAVS